MDKNIYHINNLPFQNTMCFINNNRVNISLVGFRLKKLDSFLARQKGFRMCENNFVFRISKFRGVCIAGIEFQILFPFTLNTVAFTLPSLSLLIWSLISAFNGETTMITGDGATRLSHFILSRNSEDSRWKITDFPYPVGKMATTSRPW